MIPRIFEYEGGVLKITAEAYGIPELHRIIKKYDMNAEPYLMFISGQSYPDSPYVRMPEEERIEAVLYDVKDVFGDFDHEDELIEPAIKRLRSMWESATSLMADELEQELHRWRKYIRDTPLKDGPDGNLKDRMAIAEKIEKVTAMLATVRKRADDELGPKLKGDQEMGEY